MIHNTKKLFVFLIITAVSFVIIGCSGHEDLSSNDKIEKKISLYKNTSAKIEEDFKKNSLGVGPWDIIYYKDNKLIFNNYKYAIGYSTKKGSEGIYSIIDLQKLGLHYVQGSIISWLEISSNGEKLTGINVECGEKPIKKVPIFLIDLIDEDISQLNVETNKTIFPIALNSQYYVLKHDDLMIVNIETNEIQNVPYSGYEIENSLIQDNGDIFIQDSHSNIYLLSKKENYKETKTELIGTLLDAIGDDLIWFNEGFIYKGNVKKHKKLKDIGLKRNFITYKNGKAIFESDDKPLVYDLNANTSYLFNQSLSFTELFFFPNSVSPDMDKFFTNPWEHMQIFDSKGKEYDVNITDFSKTRLEHEYFLNSNCMWLDNENLIYIAQKEDITTLDGIMIVKYNINNGENTVLFEFN